MKRRSFLSGSLGVTALGLVGMPNFAWAVLPESPLVIPAELADNPLLDFTGLPQYSKVKPEHIMPALDFLFAESKKIIEKVTADKQPTWYSFYEPMALMDDKIERAWSIVANLHSVRNEDALREVYSKASQHITDFFTWRGMHKGLFDTVSLLKQSPEFATYNAAQKKTIDDLLLNFRLSGIDLPEVKQTRLAEIKKRLSELSTTFSNNVLDATNGWSKTLTKEQLSGLNESALAAAKRAAESKGETGYRIGLDAPSYIAVITYADDANLRKEIYEASATRASDQGSNAGKWNNNPVVAEILELRLQMAKLLGFNNYAEYSVATKMADSPKQVLDFLEGLAERSRKQAKEQLQQVVDYAKTKHGVSDFQVWDYSYYNEKLKNELYNFDEESLREYFPEEKALSGLFEISKRLFGITIKEAKADVWDDTVRFYQVYDAQNRHTASFYLDMYARENKRPGAWMSTAIDRIRLADGNIQIPVAVLVCNFRKPAEGEPSLLRHDDVTTLFHEFGHGINLMLTQMEIQGVTGLNGVPWDAVEVPSQLMEGFTFDRRTLPYISSHYKTGESLPSELLDKLLESQNYQGAFNLVRQLEFGLFDMTVHTHYQAGAADDYAYKTFIDVTKKTDVLPVPDFVRRPNYFSHIFAGGYAAGYYSYLWSELFANDGFAKFRDEGILSPVIGKLFEDTILSQGGSRSLMDLYVEFRGREPKLDPLLEKYGIK